MSTGNIIITIICIVVFFAPFVLIGRKGRRRKKGLKTNVQDYANKLNYKVDQFEALDELALALDSENHIAFMTEIVANEFVTRHVELDATQTCKLNRKRRDVHTSVGNESLLSQLELSFYPKTKSEETTSFVLYDEASGKRLGDELQLGVKWVDLYKNSK